MSSERKGYTVSVTFRPATRTAGLRVRTDMRNAMKDCPAIWESFAPRMAEVPCSGRGESYGISVAVDVSDPDCFVFDYWAALPVAEDVPLPEGMEEFRLPEGEYAGFQVASLKELPAAYTWFYETWLPEREDYALNLQAPCLEAYPEDYLKTGRIILYFPMLPR